MDLVDLYEKVSWVHALMSHLADNPYPAGIDSFEVLVIRLLDEIEQVGVPEDGPIANAYSALDDALSDAHDPTVALNHVLRAANTLKESLPAGAHAVSYVAKRVDPWMEMVL